MAAGGLGPARRGGGLPRPDERPANRGAGCGQPPDCQLGTAASVSPYPARHAGKAAEPAPRLGGPPVPCGRHGRRAPMILQLRAKPIGHRRGMALNLPSDRYESSPLHPSDTMSLPVLTVLHGELSTPGRVGLELRSRGVTLDICRHGSAMRCPTPSNIMLGSSCSVVRRVPTTTTRWCAANWTDRGAADGRQAFLGICLGAQLLAKKLGARVYKHADGHAEVGYYPIKPTPAAARSARIGPTTSINGTARASICPTER